MRSIYLYSRNFVIINSKHDEASGILIHQICSFEIE